MNNKCPKCSSTFAEKTKFCKICGCNLEQELIENPTCPKCNTVFSSEIKFCTNDGVKLVHPDKLIPKCVKCKKSFSDGSKFCPNDGGAIKLDDDILRLINTSTNKNEEANNNFQETSASPPAPPTYSFPKTYNKASLGKRFLAYLLDGLIIAILFLPSLFFLFDFFKEMYLYEYYGGYSNYSGQSLIFGLLLILLPLRYALIKDGIGEGQSYGKRAVDLMVININTNEPCTKMNSAGRNIIYSIICGIPYIGYLLEVIMVIANPDGRKLSDLAAGTQVIEVEEFRSK
jgi:uncharacterized RDD family membrane protein YckC